MRKQIETLIKTRQVLLESLEGLTVQQLNKIPDGFNNNIIWNLSHLIAAQQGVCYLRAGLETIIDINYFNAFKPGSKPEAFLDEQHISLTKELLISTIEKLDFDMDKNLFVNYPTWVTRYGVFLTTIDDALDFLSFHDGLHAGYIMALKRRV